MQALAAGLALACPDSRIVEVEPDDRRAAAAQPVNARGHHVLAQQQAAILQELSEQRSVLERKQPIGRLIRPDEVADTVSFCVRNGGMTGQGLNVDGGAVQS